jgi:hypothetical protein
MRIEIRNRATGAVQFTAAIDCAEDAQHSLRLGLVVLRASKAGAALARADRAGANLVGSDLAGVNLAGVDRGKCRSPRTAVHLRHGLAAPLSLRPAPLGDRSCHAGASCTAAGGEVCAGVADATKNI